MEFDRETYNNPVNPVLDFGNKNAVSTSEPQSTIPWPSKQIQKEEANTQEAISGQQNMDGGDSEEYFKAEDETEE